MEGALIKDALIDLTNDQQIIILTGNSVNLGIDRSRKVVTGDTPNVE